MSDRSLATTCTEGPTPPAGELAPPEDTLADTTRLAVRVAGALTLAALLIALITRVVLAVQARRWLLYPFTGIPATPVSP